MVSQRSTCLTILDVELKGVRLQSPKSESLPQFAGQLPAQSWVWVSIQSMPTVFYIQIECPGEACTISSMESNEVLEKVGVQISETAVFSCLGKGLSIDFCPHTSKKLYSPKGCLNLAKVYRITSVGANVISLQVESYWVTIFSTLKHSLEGGGRLLRLSKLTTLGKLRKLQDSQDHPPKLYKQQ